MVLPRGYISHSQIRSYRECPKKYEYAYIAGILPPINEKVFLGEVFHAAIEHYFKARIGGAPCSNEAVEAFFCQAFAVAAPGREISWKTPRQETRDRGLAFLRCFLQQVAPGTKPLMVEKELAAELPDGGVLLKGVLDLVEEDYCITDFKTTTGRWSASRARSSPQMIIYKYLFERSFGPVPAGMKYEIFYGRKAANVRRQTLAVVAAPTAVADLLAMIGLVVEKIAAGEFPARITPFCRYCEFRRYCREKSQA
jgi:hypothetical protein